jgi:hypothetical protein
MNRPVVSSGAFALSVLALSSAARADGFLWLGAERAGEGNIYRYNINTGVVDLTVRPSLPPGAAHWNNMATDGVQLYLGNPYTDYLGFMDPYSGAATGSSVYAPSLAGLKEDGAFRTSTRTLWRVTFSGQLYETTTAGVLVRSFTIASGLVGLEWVGETLYATNYEAGNVGQVTLNETTKTATFTIIPWAPGGGSPGDNTVGLAYDQQAGDLYMATFSSTRLFKVTFAGGQARATLVTTLKDVGYPEGAIPDGMGWVAPEPRVRESVSHESGTLNAIAVGRPLAVASFELILDASGSMWGTVGGRAKIEIAKETMRQVIEELPDDVHVALRVYGHRVAPGRAGACQDSELVFPLAKIDKGRLVERINGLRARGTTPIAYSLSHVATDLGGIPGEKMVILVTDGKEECGGSPSRAVSALIEQGFKVQVNIVGFALGEEARSEMRRVAERTSGRFFDAGNEDALRDAIEQALAVPYDVLDPAGVKVAAGLVGKGAVTVPEGTYTVVVKLTGGPITIREVRIVANKPTTIELEQQGQEIKARVLAR